MCSVRNALALILAAATIAGIYVAYLYGVEL